MNHNIFDPLSSGFRGLAQNITNGIGAGIANGITNLISSSQMEQIIEQKRIADEQVKRMTEVYQQQQLELLMKKQAAENEAQENERQATLINTTIQNKHKQSEEFRTEIATLRERLGAHLEQIEQLQKQMQSHVQRANQLRSYTPQQSSQMNVVTHLEWYTVSSATGSNDLYQYNLHPSHHGVCTFDINKTSGPAHQPVFTATLRLSYENRQPPLRITYTLTKQMSMRDLKNTMCGTALHYLHSEGLYTSTISGDVEITPREHPIHMSTRQFQNQMGDDHEEIDDKDLRREAYRKRSNKHTARKLKNEYQRKTAKMQNTHYSGSYIDDIHQFQVYLKDHGYTSPHAKNVPFYFLCQVFEDWTRGGNLSHFDHIYSVYRAQVRKMKTLGNTPNYPITQDYLPQYPSRKLLLKAFCTNIYAEHDWLYLRVALNKATIQPPTIDITLRDIERIHTNKRWAKLSSLSTSEFRNQMFLAGKQDGWYGSTLKSVGAKIGEGVVSAVVPIIDKAKLAISNIFASFPSVEKMATIIQCIAILVFLGIFGYSLFVLIRRILFGIDIVLLEFVDMSAAKFVNQVDTSDSTGEPIDEAAAMAEPIAKISAWTLIKTFASSMGERFTDFSKAFSDSEVVKFTKKLGDFSAAIKNVYAMAEKLKDIVKWIINKSCKYFTGSSFFDDSKKLDALQSTVDSLLKTIRVESITTLSEDQKKAFTVAYMDLVEMQPFIATIDKTLAATINSAFIQAKPLYQQCIFHVKANVTRPVPPCLYIEGPAGTAKSTMIQNLTKLIFDATKVLSTKLFQKIWFGENPIGEFTRAMIYNRQVEQEYWDNYINQPVTVIDDILQSPIDEARNAESLALIRMVNANPYPLHMAAISQKDSTVFTSRLVIVTTNVPEHMLTAAELKVFDPEAFKRRRHFVIRIEKDSGHVPEGKYSQQFMEKITFKVQRPDPVKGNLDPSIPPKVYKGHTELCDFAMEVAKMMINEENEFNQKEMVDSVATMVAIQMQKNRAEFSEAKKEFLDAAARSSTRTRQMETSVGYLNVSDSDEEDYFDPLKVGPPDDDYTSVYSSSSHISIPMPTLTSDTTTTTTTTDSISTISTAMFAPQMLGIMKEVMLGQMADMRYQLHPEAKYVLLKAFGEEIKSYTIACGQVARQRRRLAQEQQHWIHAREWDHEALVSGVSNLKKFTGTEHRGLIKSYFMYRCGLFRQSKTWCLTLLKEDKQFPSDVNLEDIQPYIGLSNPIYYHEKRGEILTMITKYVGISPITYDSVGIMTTLQSVPEFVDQYMWESSNEAMLKHYRGKSSIWLYMNAINALLVALITIGALAGAAIGIWRTIDQSRKVNPEYTAENMQGQSGNKHTIQMQRALARIQQHEATQPAVLRAMKGQFEDQTATDQLVLVKNNLYVLRALINGSWGMCSALGIESHIFVIPGHVMAMKPSMLEISNHLGGTPYQYPVENLVWSYVRPNNNNYSSADLALVYFPGMHEVKKITHLLQEKPLNLTGVQGLKRLDHIIDAKGQDYYPLPAVTKPIKVVHSSDYPVLGLEKPERIECVAVFQMDGISKEGMCGSPYIYFNTHMPRKLGWVHIAGHENTHMAGLVTETDVLSFINKRVSPQISQLKNQVRQMEISFEPHILREHDKSIQYTPGDTGLYHGLRRMGTLSHKFSISSPTQYQLSPMAKLTMICEDGKMYTKPPPFDISGAPALMFKKDGIDPLPLSISAFKDKKVIFGKYLQKSDYEGIFNEPTLGNCDAHILTLREAIVGMRHHPRTHAIPRDTSTAFYLKKYGKLKKEYICVNQTEYDARKDQDYFVSLGEGVYIHRFVKMLICLWFSEVKQGKIPANWSLLCLKDEILDKAKALEGKTRAFYMGNFALMLITLMILGNFITELESNWSSSDIAVGCNPYSLDWEMIYRKLSAISHDICDDDTKKWDQNFIVHEFTETFPEEYVHFFRLEGKEVTIEIGDYKVVLRHDILIYVIVTANFNVMIVIEEIVVFSKFQPSGSILTSILNSICNAAINRCIIRIIVKKPFNQVASQWTFGDDLTLAILKSLITREQIWKAAKIMFNHTRTNPDKGENSETSHLTQIKFLARRFEQKALMICPLNMSSIESMIQWVRRSSSSTILEQFAINCKVAASELARHDKETFEKYVTQMNIYLRALLPTEVITMTYEEYQLEIYYRITNG